MLALSTGFRKDRVNVKVVNMFTDILPHFFCGSCVLFMSFVCSCLPCGRLLGRADLLALVYDVLLCFCHFPMWYPGSGMVLDCIDS